MTAESTPATVAPPGVKQGYDPEYARMEAWLDEHPDFAHDYFLRYSTQTIIGILHLLTLSPFQEGNSSSCRHVARLACHAAGQPRGPCLAAVPAPTR